MNDAGPNWLTAAAAAADIREGKLSVEALAAACLDRIAARDPAVRAWTWVDREAVLRQAREMDQKPARGKLYGVPIGVKDVIDTADMPTQHNSPLFAGHRPSLDAAAVTTLRAAGALILGKTDTTEFAAAGRHAATHNPHDLTRTAGGSSSGSAAAVADCQVPLSLGTQTGGSTIRPASFCGVFALKPTWGAVSREGVKIYSVTLDTISWYARAVEDLDLLCDVFDLHDDKPAHPVSVNGARIALCRTPAWASAEAATVKAMDAAAAALRDAGAVVTELTLPGSFDLLGKMQRAIMHAEGRAAFLSLARSRPKDLHDDFHSRVENRDGITRAQLLVAYDHAALCRTTFDAIARDYDAVLTPSAPGEAPPGTHPGDAVFNRMWTLLHVPCVNIPGFRGPGGMPVGLTLTGPRFTDRQLLAAAQAVAPCFAPASRSVLGQE
jgi:Asp-tRNA(Asn)/Glu-tRNA(Gln) amidotransferase A subunit family amidase